MIRYAVRTRQIIDLINEIRRGTLNLTPYFQRNLVWRSIHKAEFIETIREGLPFPQIFIAKGSIDVDSMVSTSSVVDGQQRMSAIMEYVEGGFSVKGKRFDDLSTEDKTEILKYEVAVIDIDLKDDEPQIVDIFKRLNRTFYALSLIERYSTEFASSEFMLVAKFMSKELELPDQVANDDAEPSIPDLNIPQEFLSWARGMRVKAFPDMLLDGRVFSPYETARMVHLMFTLNLITTFVYGFYNRNEKAKELMETFAQGFPEKDNVVSSLEEAADIFSKIRLSKGSVWLRKANCFSVMIALAKNLIVAMFLVQGARAEMGLSVTCSPSFIRR